MTRLRARSFVKVLVALAAAATVTTTAAPARAATASSVSTTTSVSAAEARYRQYLGTVVAPTFLEASVPHAGTYAIQYVIRGTAFFDTYLDGTELGYVGGVTGRYRTRSVQLSAGGHLVQVVGPEGSGRARVYIISTR